MIKDSKLIGTKIAAPFGWKKFKVGDLFDVQSTKAVNYDELMSDGKYPYIVRSANNNGIREYMSGDSSMLNKGHCITLGIDTASYFYQDCNKFFAGVKVKALYLLNRELSENIALYLIECLSRYVTGYGYAGGKPFKVMDFLNELLVLPVTFDNQPDFDWMSAYIKAVKADYLEQKELSNRNEIEAYLSAGNTDSTDITDDDRQFLRDFEKLPRRKFKVGELFDFKSSMSLDKSDLTFVSKNNPFAIPYITRTVLNNGINGYVDSRLVDNEYINAGNEFAFGLLGLTAFYQCNNYCTGQFVKRFVPKFKLTELLAMFFKTLLDRQIEVFKTVSIRSYSQLINNTLEIELPVIDSSQIDVDSIEKYMQIQSKPLINNVVKTLVPVGGGGNLN